MASNGSSTSGQTAPPIWIIHIIIAVIFIVLLLISFIRYRLKKRKNIYMTFRPQLRNMIQRNSDLKIGNFSREDSHRSASKAAMSLALSRFNPKRSAAAAKSAYAVGASKGRRGMENLSPMNK